MKRKFERIMPQIQQGGFGHSPAQIKFSFYMFLFSFASLLAVIGIIAICKILD